LTGGDIVYTIADVTQLTAANLKGNQMKVSEYRDLISACCDVLASLKSAATSHEMRMETERLDRAVAELAVASCPRASERDRARAASVLANCRATIDANRAAFRAADANYQRMAFASGY